ncbi:MAG: hypothetical protein JO333_08795, partial [Verrucomicrobia bacterium]|nr:hypothetical protein [Verrucomicrobiota bacterium]
MAKNNAATQMSFPRDDPDGVITVRDTDVGALIQNGATPGQKELFHLAAIGKLRVYISVPEVSRDGGEVWRNRDTDTGSVPGTDVYGHHCPKLQFYRL